MRTIVTMTLLALAASHGIRAQSTPQPARPAAAEKAPTVSEILEKYVQAVGGKQAIERIQTRVIRGTMEGATGEGSPMEIYQTASGKWLMAVHGSDEENGLMVCDGNNAWQKFGDQEPHAFGDAELAEARVALDLRRELKLKELFPKMGFKGKESVGGREVYVISAATAQGSPEQLYFDRETGLLVRQDSKLEGPDGLRFLEVDYEDYREVDGVRLPFTIRRLDVDSTSTFKVLEVKHNVPIDEAKFAKPGA